MRKYNFQIKVIVGLALAVALAVVVTNPLAVAKDAKLSESQIKAGLLVKIIQNTSWESRPGAEPIVVGVLGADPFKGALEEMVSQAKQPISVLKSDILDKLSGCNVVYVSSSMDGKDVDIFGGLLGADVLIVGESDGFAKNGGTVEFFVKNNQVKFKVNVKKYKSLKLRFSPQLLKAAGKVGK